MKLLLVTDQHFGIGNGDKVALYHNLKYLHESLLPALNETSISEIVDLGDTFDSSFLGSQSFFRQFVRYYLIPLLGDSRRIHILGGNHGINPLSQLIDYVPQNLRNRVLIYNKHARIRLGGYVIDFLPWNAKISEVKHQPGVIALGHLQVRGMPANPERFVSSGIEISLLRGYRRVFSGHLHTAAEKGNLVNIGSSSYIRWQDCLNQEVRGSMILDLNTAELTRIANTALKFLLIKSEKDLDANLDRRDLKIYVPLTESSKFKQKAIKTLASSRPASLEIISGKDRYLDDVIVLLDSGYYLSAFRQSLNVLGAYPAELRARLYAAYSLWILGDDALFISFLNDFPLTDLYLTNCQASANKKDRSISKQVKNHAQRLSLKMKSD